MLLVFVRFFEEQEPDDEAKEDDASANDVREKVRKTVEDRASLEDVGVVSDGVCQSAAETSADNRAGEVRQRKSYVKSQSGLTQGTRQTA